jgi:DNA-binding transcriptional LysR family regulator
MNSPSQPITRVNLKLLQAFLIVAESGSFREAANQTNRSQSAVSAQIKQLEAQLGVILFNRTTRSVKMTTEGQELLSSAKRALHEIEQGLRRIHESADLRRGRVSLACSPTVAASHLPRILSAFEQDYPQISIDVREMPSASLFESVRKMEVDFGVGPVIADADLSFDIILDDPLFALVPKALMPEARTSISLQDLAMLPVLLLSTATAMRKLLESAMQANGLSFKTKYQCIQVQTMAAMAEAGLGAAILPHSTLPKADSLSTRRLRIVNPSMKRQIAIVQAHGQTLSPAAARLAELIRLLIDPRKLG